MTFESIRTLIKADLDSTDQFIISQLASHIELIKEMTEYVLSCGGKRIRPTVLLLVAAAVGNQSKKNIDLAAVIELIHTATLLHDDVVDESTLRRGHKTANTIWGSDASVLIGDFLYSRAFQIVVDLNHSQILHLFAHATHFIAEGEILQLVNCNNPDTTEAFYFDIIERKTAKLFEIAAQLGAIIGGASSPHIQAFKEYGKHLGLAYQLIDDALDYQLTTDKTGKNVGQDLDEGKATLPLIYAMQHTDATNHKIIQTAISDGSSENLQTILHILESTKAIAYTADTAKIHVEKAKLALANIPSSPYLEALLELCDFVVERNY